MPSVYITSVIPKECRQMLQSKGFDVQVNGQNRDLTKKELVDVFSKYDAIITLMTDRIDKDVLSAASKKLKAVANYAVGYDNIDLNFAAKKNITICNTPGVASEAVAEHTFLLIFACAKRLIEADKFVRLGKYQRWDPMSFLSNQIWGKTIGIIGLGKIGTFVAQIAYGGLRMKILYFDSSRSEDFELLTEATYCSVDKILKESDIITLHVPLTVKTRHLISKKEFKIMKNTAILINTARGAIVNEEDLIWALKNKEIAAAGLDVFENEPHIAHDLTILDNVVLTPHIASATVETRISMAKITAQNVIDIFEEKEPFGLVKV
ncbi:MAG TPA: D-glycerate dehydrogenase [Patescibacteria group bacterium]|nr:D-glycerate dehydrogenase [Patescibacteria group bacterium]